MRLLQVCPRYYPDVGGVEQHVQNISERIARTHKITIFTTDPSGRLPEQEIINKVEIRRFRSYAPSGAYYFSEGLRKSLKRSSDQFDIVHAHNYQAFPSLYAAQAKRGNRFVFTAHYHGTGHTFFRALIHRPYKLFGKRIFKNADKIVCVSSYERNLLVKNFGIPEEKLIIIPNGVDQAEFNGLKKQKKDFRVILCVSRLEKYKGIHHLIKALPKVNDDIVLEVVGEGPYGKRLIKLAEKCSVRNRVRFRSNLSRKELLQEYVNADLCVSLSLHEAYGLSIADSLASGVPCLVANTSGLSEWIDNTHCFGINLPINIDKLAYCLSENIGRAIEKPNLPSWDDIANRIEKVYNSI